MGKKFTPVPEQTALAHALIILNSTRPYSDIILVLSELVNPSGSSLNFNCLDPQVANSHESFLNQRATDAVQWHHHPKNQIVISVGWLSRYNYEKF